MSPRIMYITFNLKHTVKLGDPPPSPLKHTVKLGAWNFSQLFFTRVNLANYL